MKLFRLTLYLGADALACAARLHGCVSVLCVAAFAPYDAEGLDWLAGKEEASKWDFDLMNHDLTEH
jgi:hypothetical protein